MIRNAISFQDWAGLGMWSRASLMESGGGVGKIKVFRQRNESRQSLEMPVREYLEWLETHPPGDAVPDLLVDFSLSKGNVLVDSHDKIVSRYYPHLYSSSAGPSGGGALGLNNMQFMIGPALAGASVHFHYTTARLMVHGRARWFLWPPAKAFYSSRQIYEWYQTDYPSLQKEERPLECVQGPGDLIYLPPVWAHGVLYLQDTAGMASLFRA
ncbi:hypothetical protein T484DRAFT_1877255 [Baffinella frigidus]|nr:hypothetical protein T484DRAFT_1877255 [Cryptophyta sp. CCMP2293]